ncbi:MAG: LON peptidase substrate-binding domain-containing protein [Burkholderiaceae bacterium]
MSAHRITLPIFPLNTVLFPGGLLPLRIFEARYMDMIRRAMRDASEFGVCLIRKGHEVGERGVETETIGCRARIDDWNMEQLGVLQIATTGTERFIIVSHAVQADGLMIADVEPIEHEAYAPLPEEAVPCASLLERIMSQWEAHEHASGVAESDAVRGPAIGKPYRFDDTTWVGNRLSEVLPVSLAAKQKLMALTDGPTRIAIVLRYLKQHGIV